MFLFLLVLRFMSTDMKNNMYMDTRNENGQEHGQSILNSQNPVGFLVP